MRSAVLMRLFSRGVSSSESRTSIASKRTDPGAFQTAHDLVEGFQCPRHLQPDQVVPGAVEHGRGQLSKLYWWLLRASY